MNRKEKKFVETVWEYYERHGRRSLPWRRTKNPYHILVSEIMLQQTQVERVIPKYKEFINRFPAAQALADATLGDVLRVWQGLGYNRRAKMLYECAKVLNKKCKGLIPNSYEELVKLPGVGPYTGGAILAFAYSIPVPIIETNIRSVYLHHFFRAKENITDKEIIRLIERTLDSENPREWYYALMDYGAYIKKEFGNPNIKSKHHTKQKAFKGSDREVRGAILRVLAEKEMSTSALIRTLTFSKEKLIEQLSVLCKEVLVVRRGQRCTLPE